MSSDDSEEENVIRYGTPLDPIDEDELPAKRKYQQPSEQFAVDAHGRRRFHGAFMGGFSAGYGNTVGTAEGWAPATFKSSRSEKASVSSQRPEDFMDEEDRDEFGIAPRTMQTQSEFTGRKRQAQQRFYDGTIPGAPILEHLLRPVHETAAVRMLRAMGWREGRGAGGQVTKTERKKAREQHKVYGCHVPEEFRQPKEMQPEESSDSEFEYDQLFEPEDYEPYILARKDDTFGLGYSGLSRHSVLGDMTGEYGAGSSVSHLVMKEKGKKVSIRGQAFGVGALEDDDQDIYAIEDMSHYDFEMGGPREPVKQKLNKDRGPNILPGFVKAAVPLPAPAAHPAPALPRGYRPAVRRSRFDSADAGMQRDQGLGRHELSAEARGQLLGETAPTNTQTNIQADKQSNIQADKQTDEQTDIIAKITGRNINFTSTNTDCNSTGESSNSKELDFIPIHDTGKEIVNVFKPFKSDPKKQERYERYLKDKSSLSERDSDRDKLSEWERDREIAEFEQAAKLYKPLSGAIGDRFTHASEPDDALNPLKAVARSAVNYGLATPEQIEAANKGVYGVMTRKVFAWMPESLVCKRFNVPEIGGARPEKQKEDKPKVSYSIFSYLESSVHNKDSFTKEQTKFSGSKSSGFQKISSQDNNTNKPSEHQMLSVNNKTDNLEPITQTPNKRITVAELFMKESEKALENNDKEVMNTIEQFDKMDLYKSIFLSDTEDEDEAPKIDQSDKNVDYNAFIETPKNVERNTSPPKGIFANINFDELNSWKRKADDAASKNIETSETNIGDGKKNIEDKDSGQNAEELLYGPKIPENLQKRLELVKETDTFKPTFRSREERDKQTIEIGSSSSEDGWVVATNKKSKKKSKKHKSKHKKSKHKKKDR